MSGLHPPLSGSLKLLWRRYKEWRKNNSHSSIFAIEGCNSLVSDRDVRVGDVVAIYTRKNGPEDLFEVGTVLAVSMEKLQVQYWHRRKKDSMWFKTSVKRFGGSFRSAKLNISEHIGIVMRSSDVIDSIPSLIGKDQGKIDHNQLICICALAREHRQGSPHTSVAEENNYSKDFMRSRQLFKSLEESRTSHIKTFVRSLSLR